MEERLSRRLAIILHADVVGSTRLVLQNETLAHARIQDVFHRFSKTIQLYGGSALEVRGDALVAKFERASDAVCAALAFQAANAEFNATDDDDLKPRLRVGIGMGEVVIADNTVTGAGVVLAQRLEQVAEHGGVCIQGAVYETLPKRLPFDYQSLGEQELKGFEEPFRAYAATLKPGEISPAPDPRPTSSAAQTEPSKRVWLAGGIIALIIVVGGVLVWLEPWEPRNNATPSQRLAPPQSDPGKGEAWDSQKWESMRQNGSMRQNRD
jgi:adenylate cyclase